VQHGRPLQANWQADPSRGRRDYGHLVVSWDTISRDLGVIPIRWSTGEPLHTEQVEPNTLDLFKASYRYQLDKAC